MCGILLKTLQRYTKKGGNPAGRVYRPLKKKRAPRLHRSGALHSLLVIIATLVGN